MNARPLINSLDFARNGQEISGEVPVAELLRLQDMLENPQGILSYTVTGSLDKQGNHWLNVSAAGECQLRCQRCLGSLSYPIRIDSHLLLCDQATLDALDDDEDEAFDGILADDQLDVLSLLEDEILLSLPIAPRHELGVCQAIDGENRHREEKNPFAVLANLKCN